MNSYAKETTTVNEQVKSEFYFGGVGAASKFAELMCNWNQFCRDSEGNSEYPIQKMAELGYKYHQEEYFGVCEDLTMTGHTVRMYRITESFIFNGENVIGMTKTQHW